TDSDVAARRHCPVDSMSGAGAFWRHALMPSRRVSVVTFLPSSRLLSERNFGLFWLAGLISIVGDWALRIALPIYVLRLTGSASALPGVGGLGLVGGPG